MLPVLDHETAILVCQYLLDTEFCGLRLTDDSLPYVRRRFLACLLDLGYPLAHLPMIYLKIENGLLIQDFEFPLAPPGAH